jgi:hypothetical protein
MEASTADYTCLCADDALLHPRYVELLHDAMQSDPDCIGFMLQIGDRLPEPHSIAFAHAPGFRPWTGQACDLGTWMPVKRSIGSQVRFHGPVDDWEWTRGVLATGLLKHEVYLGEVLITAREVDQGFHGHWDPVAPTPDPPRPFVTYI